MARFLFDVDGVCAQFIEPLIEQTQITSFTAATLPQWHLDPLLTEAEKEKVEALLRQRYFWDSLPVMPGAQDAIQNLRGDGHEIVFVTSSWPSCSEWASARIAWLQRRFSAHRNDVVITSRKSIISGDVFIDDKESHVLNWAATPGAEHTAFLFKAPYNRKHDVVDWDLIATWFPQLGRFFNEYGSLRDLSFQDRKQLRQFVEQFMRGASA